MFKLKGKAFNNLLKGKFLPGFLPPKLVRESNVGILALRRIGNLRNNKTLRE